ncbi:MAG: hypothetical protein SV487_12610 [Thermodesulfobacteriota bacterium]|nr:hypothetical protein [Thermodesulfobacteriota bacterium]
MQIHQLTETYTNLARLSREALIRADKKEARPPVLLGENARAERPDDQAANKDEALAPVLKLDEAQVLVLALTDWIKATAGTGPGLDLHDLSAVKIIGPRYV